MAGELTIYPRAELDSLLGGYAKGYVRGREDGERDARRSAAPARKIIRAKFAGVCQHCGAHWQEGDRIAWAKGAGATCMACMAVSS